MVDTLVEVGDKDEFCDVIIRVVREKEWEWIAFGS